jgi:hypothetical protein
MDMTATYNPAEVERLIAEAREALADLDSPDHSWLTANGADVIDQLEAARAEVDRLSALVSVSPDDVREVADENTRVEAENERLRQAFDELIKSLDAGGTIRSAFCSWCNQRWPHLDGETYEVTRQYANDHLKTCPAHPLRADLFAAQAEIASAQAVLYRTGVPGGLSLTEGTEWLARCRPVWDDVEPLRRDLAAANASILRLTESARAAAENWMSACRQRDEAKAECERLRPVFDASLAMRAADRGDAIRDDMSIAEAEAIAAENRSGRALMRWRNAVDAVLPNPNARRDPSDNNTDEKG